MNVMTYAIKPIAIVLAIGVLAAGANAGFYERKSEGWYWYQDPKEKLKPEPEQPLPPKKTEAPPLPPSEPKKEAPVHKKVEIQTAESPFSVKWFQKNLDELREIAINDPTEENVSNYLYAQRVMFDKAETFSDVAAYVSKTDPFLDENNRFPFSNAASFYVMAERGKAKDKALAALSQKTALWFFFSSRCPSFCAIQYETIKGIAKSRGFLVKNVSLDGVPLEGMKDFATDQGQFASFGLAMTPSVVMVSPPNTIAIVSQGALAQSELEDRILLAGTHYKLLPEDISKEINLFERGRMRAEDLNDLKKRGIDPDDPKSWVTYLRQTLKGRY